MTAFSELPLEVKATVKSRLTAYSEVHVSLNEDTGTYTAMSAIVIHNGTYDKHIGTYKSEDVFTLEERIINYVD